MIKITQSAVRVTVFCLPLLLVASCGSGSEAVQGTVINIDPVSLTQPTVAETPTGTPPTLTVFTNAQTYRIEARSPTGYPQIGVKVIINSPFTVYEGHPTSFTGLTPLTLPYDATTGPNGTYEVTVVYSWSGGVKGTVTSLEAFSGTGNGKTDIVFTCLDPNAVGTGPDCPT